MLHNECFRRQAAPNLNCRWTEDAALQSTASERRPSGPQAGGAHGGGAQARREKCWREQRLSALAVIQNLQV